MVGVIQRYIYTRLGFVCFYVLGKVLLVFISSSLLNEGAGRMKYDRYETGFEVTMLALKTLRLFYAGL